MNIKTTIPAFALALALGAAGSTQAASMEKVKAAVSWVGLWDTSQPTFCSDRGKFKEAGLEVEIVSTRGGSETVQAVISGGMDIGYSPGTNAAIAAYAKGAPIKIVSSEFIGQNDTYFYVPVNSPIKSVDDVPGKKVGYPRPGGAGEAILLGLKAERGIEFEAVVTGGMDATRTMTMTGQIDIGWSVPPYGLDAVEKGEIRVVFSGDVVESQRKITNRVNIANAEFLEKRRPVAEKFFSVLKECIEWAYENPDESLKMYADINKVSLETAKLARDFYGKEQLALAPILSLDKSIEQAVEQGFIDKPLSQDEIDDMIDLLVE